MFSYLKSVIFGEEGLIPKTEFPQTTKLLHYKPDVAYNERTSHRENGITLIMITKSDANV